MFLKVVKEEWLKLIFYYDYLIKTASVNFIEKWNEILKGTERKLVKLLLMESVIVSKTIEDRFEEKLKETFPNNFRSIRNQIKEQSKEVVTTLENRRRNKWHNIKNKNGFASKRTLVRESREHSSSDRFKNVTCERDRRRKLKEKSLKLSTNDTRSFPPEASTCKLMPSGDNQIATNVSSRKCKNENVRESYASVTRRVKKVHKSIQKKDDQLERSTEDSADFVIKSRRSYGNKSVRDSKVDFSELLRSLRKDDRSFTKTVVKPPESPSTSGSINTAGNVTSRDDLDSGDEELVNILHDMHTSQGVTAEKSPKCVNGRMKWYFCSKTV